ncbi:DUF192 domain-containing protein [Candidatus Parcubacteria bacterium]|nr:MAG: DUF192 domain-containing protein [Candidatus Parcubacteria bacterium]
MITIKAKNYKDLKQKTIGLIGKDRAENIYFETRSGIHTFGLKFPIDVLVLDEKNKVVKLKEELIPNSLFFWNPKYKKVLELQPETISKQKIKTGSSINIELINQTKR